MVDLYFWRNFAWLRYVSIFSPWGSRKSLSSTWRREEWRKSTFYYILVHPALMSPPTPVCPSVPSRISQQPWAPVLPEQACLRPSSQGISDSALSERWPSIHSHDFSFFFWLTFDYSNVFRSLPRSIFLASSVGGVLSHLSHTSPPHCWWPLSVVQSH